MSTAVSRTARALTPAPEALTLQAWHQTRLACIGTLLMELRVASEGAGAALFAGYCMSITGVVLLLAGAVHLRVYEPPSAPPGFVRARSVLVGSAVLAMLLVLPATALRPSNARRAPSTHSAGVRGPDGSPARADRACPGRPGSTRRRGVHRLRLYRRPPKPTRSASINAPNASAAYPIPWGSLAEVAIARLHAHHRTSAMSATLRAATTQTSAILRPSCEMAREPVDHAARPTSSKPKAAFSHARKVRSFANRAGREITSATGTRACERADGRRRTRPPIPGSWAPTERRTRSDRRRIGATDG